MVYRRYACCYCGNDIVEGYPAEEDEPQFCCKECRDKYLEEHKKLPTYVLVNSVLGIW